MFASVLTAIGMVISVLVEILLRGSGSVAVQEKCNGKPENTKEWLRDKLKELALLLGRLSTKVSEALPGTIRTVISWILNRVKEVVGWVLQNL